MRRNLLTLGHEIVAGGAYPSPGTGVYRRVSAASFPPDSGDLSCFERQGASRRCTGEGIRGDFLEWTGRPERDEMSSPKRKSGLIEDAVRRSGDEAPDLVILEEL